MLTKALIFLVVLNLVAADVWTNLALQSQREGMSDITLETVSFPCSHNSFQTTASLPPLVLKYENLILLQNKVVIHSQTMSVTDQLNAGIRHLQIEVHFIPEWNLTYICHASPAMFYLCPLIEAGSEVQCDTGVGVTYLGQASGCTQYDTPWEEGIQQIATWLQANPNEFLLLEVFDFASTVSGSNLTQLAWPVAQYLGNNIFTNTALNAFRSSTGNHWPTLSQLQATNKTVLLTGILSNSPSISDYVVSLDSDLVYPQTMAKNFQSSTCNNNLSPNFTAFYEDTTKVILEFLNFNVSDDNTVTVGEFTDLHAVTSCGFTGCMDDVSDYKLSQVVWSWAAGYSKISCQQDVCAAVNNNTWTHLPCSSSYQAACRDSSSGAWSLSGPSVFSSASCPAGTTFAFPRTPLENKALLSVVNGAGSNPVWLNIGLSYQPNHAVCTYVPVKNTSSASSLSSSFTLLFICLISLFVLL